MVRVFGGAALVVAGIAAFIVAHTHRPMEAVAIPGGLITKQEFAREGVVARPASGLSQTAYDLLRIGGWALLIFGALLIVVGLIGYARRPAS